MSERRKQYPFDEIEPKWQLRWDEEETFKTPNPGEEGFDASKPKYYVLDMFPYPSGSGLHVGHPEGYTATDILGRYKRKCGFNVLHPMGWDAFGLPAEQHAMKTGEHPRINTEQNLNNFRRQLKRLGFSYDWSREVNTTDPGYVRWTQWIFLQLYNSYFDADEQKAKPIADLEAKGWTREQIDAVRLAYVDEVPVNWSPSLGTVLANEEVEEWKAKGETVERRPLKQWMLRITAYAERLIHELDGLDWPEGIKLHQRNWIGRSEGAEVKFQIGDDSVTVFTTRPDTLFGATYMVLAPEHPLVDKIATDAQREAIEAYKQSVAGKSDLDRTELNKGKTGVFTGATATNPVNGEEIPVWIADYVMMSYGTGAIMAVPAHDERDFEFAREFGLAIVQVVQEGRIGVPPVPAETPAFMDAGSETSVSERHLPHWQQSGKTYFVTWRLADSLPKEKLEQLEEERDAWLAKNPKPWDDNQESDYHARFSERIDEWLDAGEGSCILREAESAAVVGDALKHFDGERYDLHAAVVMPNHVHLLVELREGEDLSKILHSWKSFTAKELNKRGGTKGKVWQDEYYDRLIRNQKHFDATLGYVWDNPSKAKLSEGEYWRLQRDESGTGGTPILPSCESVFSGHGTAVNSGFLDGLPTPEAKAKISEWLEEKALGKKTINYKLRDWLFSRQRYWGEPFPIEWDAEGNHRALPDAELPLLAPELEDYKPSGTPEPLLAKATEWVDRGDGVKRETNTMPQWAGSCWYYLRYCDAQNSKDFVSDEAERYWMGADSDKPGGVDLYVGGTEHAVLHLLYARFWHKVLHDLGHVSTIEPFQRLVNQGLILGEMEFAAFRDGEGNFVSFKDVHEQDYTFTSKKTGEKLERFPQWPEAVEKDIDNFVLKEDPTIQVRAKAEKMSKSRGNVVNPDDIMDEFGTDSLRLYEMFMGPLEQVKPWNTKGVEGILRFLARAWRLFMEADQEGNWQLSEKVQEAEPDKALLKVLHETIKKVTQDTESLSFNTAIAQMMVLTNALTQAEVRPVSTLATFLHLLNPYAPHLSEELNERLTEKFTDLPEGLLSGQTWPEWNEACLVEDEVEMVVQVNGKLRDKITVALDAAKEDIEAMAKECEKVQPFLEGNTIRKIIVVPKKLVNIVAN